MAFEITGNFVAGLGFFVFFILLICGLFAMLLVKNVRAKAKIGVVVGIILILLSGLMIFFGLRSGRSILEIIGTGEITGGFGLFVFAAIGIFAWSIIMLSKKN